MLAIVGLPQAKRAGKVAILFILGGLDLIILCPLYFTIFYILPDSFSEQSGSGCNKNTSKQDGQYFAKTTKPAVEVFDKLFVPTVPLVGFPARFLVL